MEQAVYLGNGGEEATLALAALSSRRVNARGYGTGVAARLAGAAGQQLAPRGCRRVGTADAREAVATTDVGRGGGGVLGVAGRVAWAQGERNRRRTQGRRWHWYICATPLYSRCHPPTGSKGPLSRCVLPTGSKGIPLLPVGNTHWEQMFFWRATKLQPTFTPGWE